MNRRHACIAFIIVAAASCEMGFAEYGRVRTTGQTVFDVAKIKRVEWTRVGDGRWYASPPYYGTENNGPWSWNRQPFPHRFYSAYPPYYGPHYGTHPGPRAYRYYGGYYW